jgi:putative endonuclease
MAAAQALRKKGYDILAANFRTRLGEIDIIAADDQYIVFVEVKTRAKNSMILPREAVNQKKQHKIILAAQEYLSLHSTALQPRFDVIEITTAGGENFTVLAVNHIENAFSLS